MTENEFFTWAKRNNKLQGIFTKAVKVGEIDEGEVFELSADSDEPLIIGLPCFYVVNAKRNRITEVFGEEAFRIMDKLEEQKDKIAGETLIYSYRCDGTMLPEYGYLKLYESGKVVLESGSLIDGKKESKETLNIPEDRAAEIKRIIIESGILKIGKIEDGEMIILDGVEDTLYFSDGENSKKIEIDNFWDRRRTKNIEKYPNLNLLTKTYRAIKHILLSCGVNKDYC